MRLGAWKAASGTFLATVLFVGCFAPVVYGVYKVYETSEQQTINLLVNEKPDKVYAAALDAAEKNSVEVSNRNDKERYFEAKRKDGIAGTVRVITGPEQKGSGLVITVKKGKDPAAERKSIINSALSVCETMKIQCSEQQEKKK